MYSILHDLSRLESLGIFLSAFLGAFFAFLFTRFGTLVDRLFSRRQKHRTGLVAIEKQGNEYQNLIGDNLFVVKDYTDIANRQLADKQPFIYFNELHELRIDKEIDFMLGNIDMVNELFSFEASVIKINSSIRSLNRFMSLMQDAFVNKNIDLETHLINVEIILSKLAEITIFLTDLERENQALIAKSRVLIKSNDRSLYAFLLRRVMKKNFTKSQIKQFPAELKTLKEEVEETKTTDRKRIDELLKLLKNKNGDS